MRRYTKEQEKKMIPVIQEWMGHGLSDREIAGKLNDLGMTNLLGNPFNSNNVWQFRDSRRAAFRVRAVRHVPRMVKPPEAAHIIAALYADPGVSEGRFRRMVGAYFGLV